MDVRCVIRFLLQLDDIVVDPTKVFLDSGFEFCGFSPEFIIAQIIILLAIIVDVI